MDTRRLIIVMGLSFIVLVGWQHFSAYMGWTPAPESAPQTQPLQDSIPRPESGQTASTPALPTTVFQPSEGKDIIIETPLYKAVFNTAGGFLQSFELKKYLSTDSATLIQMIRKQAAAFAPLGILINGQPSWSAGSWSYDGPNRMDLADGSASVELHGLMSNVAIKRTLRFESATYVISEQLELLSDTNQMVSLGYTLSTGELSGPEEYQSATQVARLQNGSFEEVSDKKDLGGGMSFGANIGWAATMGNYFVAAILPADADFNMDAKLQDDIYRIALKKSEINLNSGQAYQSNVAYYFGPKKGSDLAAAPNNFITVQDYGWFGWIAKPLLSMLQFFHSFVGNYGVAIILLTVVIKIVLWPLSYKSYKSMESMKKIQPLMTKVREKYKDNKQRMNQEMMQLYKTYKINPMGGCLPILVQLPIFFGLYRALLTAIELRQASFIDYLPFTDIVWLADLSLKDPFYITPLIMGGTMFLQQKLTPAPGDPTQAKIMLFMPVIFTFMFMNFPSGLVIYWLTNNVISIAQQQWQLSLKKS